MKSRTRNLYFGATLIWGLSSSGVARGDIAYYVAPDRFEIEVVSGIPSLRVSKTSDGVVGRVTLVPAYDVALSAIAYHHRASTEEIEITRLSTDVVDVKLNNRLTKSAISVQRIEKERDRDRVHFRIVFTSDFTVEQARLMLTSTGVYGEVTGTFLCPEGVPEKICDFKKRAVPAFNQFQLSGDSERQHAFTRYVSLNRFKAEIMAANAGRVASGDGLDRMGRETLLVETSAAPPTCRPELEAYPKWICRLLLEESSAGSFSEAIFALARKAFPEQLVTEDYSRFVFDANGTAVAKLSDPPSYRGASPRRVVETPPLPPQRAYFEGELARWGKGAIDSTTYRQHLNRYVKWVFQDASESQRDEIIATLMLLKSFEANARINEILVSIPIWWHEMQHGDARKLQVARQTLVDRRAPVPFFKLTVTAASGSSIKEKFWNGYIDRYYPKVDDDERKALVKKLSAVTSLAGSPEFNVEQLRYFFMELERMAPGWGPEGG